MNPSLKSHLGMCSVLGLALLLAGCGGKSSTDSLRSPDATLPQNPASAQPSKSAQPAARVTDRPANPLGVVFVVEYHDVVEKEARWDRSIEAFRKDLERLYRLGFRPVTLSEYLENRMTLPPGASPVVFTFDDSTPSQFRLLEDGSIDPECAVGVWQAFAQEHPDFPVRASFFVLPDSLWGPKAQIDRKIEQIKAWGSELGSHTQSHANLSKLSDDEAKKELAQALDFLAEKGFDHPAIALPYGASPKNRELLKGFEYEGKSYRMSGALLVGSNPAPAPGTEKFDAYRIPRIQAIEGEFGLTDWLDRLERGEVKPYVAP